MGKAVELREVEIAALKPYERNAKQHSKEQVGKNQPEHSGAGLCKSVPD